MDLHWDWTTWNRLIDVISVLVSVLSADLKEGVVLYVTVPFVCYLFSMTLVLRLFAIVLKEF